MKNNLYNEFYCSVNDILKPRITFQNDFNEVVSKMWGKPITLYQALADKSYFDIIKLFPSTKVEQTSEFALASLFSKACLIIEEIIALLKAGYPDGAMALSRTLHELKIYLLFLVENIENIELFKRYYDYIDVEHYRDLKAYKEHCAILDMPFDMDEQLSELAEKCLGYELKYGADFLKKDNSWYLFIDGCNSFRDIEKYVGGDIDRIYYKFGCGAIHSSPTHNYRSIGLRDNEDAVLLSGPSIYGLELPAHFSLNSLLNIIRGILYYFRIECSVYFGYKEIVNDIQKEFIVSSMNVDNFYKDINENR